MTGDTPDLALSSREQRLRGLLAACDSAIIAFSGGVDSAYLAWAATQVLGPSALCVTADSPSYPDHHRQLALRIAREFGLRHEFVQTSELAQPEYRANPVDRCYHCKHELYDVLSTLAADRGITTIMDGSNADDRSDYRPGRKAAREHGVQSPLDVADLSKTDIRELSRLAGLPTWNEPASACLSSRIPYHNEVTDEKLRMIERAENVLRSMGFRVCRVRHHETLARLEFGKDEIARASEPDVLAQITKELRAVGYQEIEVDPRGYRMGSLNEGVRLRPA
ncbi:MAG: ATP-dependent sacrificial sulfur transferase LarE [Acidobacteria bacterium]|nr:ATP-dependent sacrificial sulfur transferase LarE [Acidobacteriota bacterium]